MSRQRTVKDLLIQFHRMARPNHLAFFVQEPGLRDGLRLKLSG